MNTESLLIVMAVLLIAFAIYNGIKVINIYRRKSASAGWPTTTAKVLSRDVSSTRNSKSNSVSYRAEITYHYAVQSGSFEK